MISVARSLMPRKSPQDPEPDPPEPQEKGRWFAKLLGAPQVLWVWINTYENTIFSGMNIHKSRLF